MRAGQAKLLKKPGCYQEVKTAVEGKGEAKTHLAKTKLGWQKLDTKGGNIWKRKPKTVHGGKKSLMR